METLETASEKIIHYANRLYAKGFVVGYDGNISMRVEDTIIMTPTRVCKGDLTPGQLVFLDYYSGRILNDKKPSSEKGLHFLIYQLDGVRAVIHAHPFFATTYALGNKVFDAQLLTESQMNLNEITYINCFDPGTEQLVQAVRDNMSVSSKAILLRQHGSITWGTKIEDAYAQTESLERLAKTCYFYDMLRA